MNQEILQNLRDVHLPAPPSWWPPSLLVSLLLGLIFLAILGAVKYYFATRRTRRIKKELMKELQTYKNQYLNFPDKALLQSQICALLRRVLIFKNAQKNVSSLAFANLDHELKSLFPRSKNLDTFRELATKDRFHKEPNIDAEHLLNLAHEHFKKCRL